MCASCGCGKPNDDHGDAANITVNDIERAASAAGISTEEAAKNMQAAC